MTTKISGIYVIKRGDRLYVGSAVNISARWNRHKNSLRKNMHENPHLQNAWNKYGEEAFEFVVLEECDVEQLLEREQHYLDQGFDQFYNCSPTAGSRLGMANSPESKRKTSESLMGHVVSEETREKLKEAHTGRKMSEETKKKIGLAHRGRKRSPETCANISAALIEHHKQRKLGDTNE